MGENKKWDVRTGNLELAFSVVVGFFTSSSDVRKRSGCRILVVLVVRELNSSCPTNDSSLNIARASSSFWQVDLQYYPLSCLLTTGSARKQATTTWLFLDSLDGREMFQSTNRCLRDLLGTLRARCC